MSLRFNSCGNVDCTCSNHTKVPEYSMSDQVRANALPQRKLASPSNSKSEDTQDEKVIRHTHKWSHVSKAWKHCSGCDKWRSTSDVKS